MKSNKSQEEYGDIQPRLAEKGRVLVNLYTSDDHNLFEINDHNADLVVTENLKDISRVECIIVYSSIKNNTYIGYTAEMCTSN